MKDKLIDHIIHYLLIHPSYMIQKIIIQMLYHYTAKAFQQHSKIILFQDNQHMLVDYAHFTKYCLKGDHIDLNHVYDQFYHLGKMIKRCIMSNDLRVLNNCIRFLYQNIQIQIEGDLPGEIIISKCFFSQVYSCQECMMISKMDQGLIEGIISGGNFYFIERQTEGKAVCKAIKEKQ